MNQSEIVREFRERWRSGERRLISDFLANVKESRQQDLLDLLVPIEVELRAADGERGFSHDYVEFGQRAVELAEDSLAESISDLDTVDFDLANSDDPPREPTSEKHKDPIDGFKLIRKLGEGGMGVVWLAEQSEPIRRKVALKLIKSGMNSGAVTSRFEIERQSLALMDHPNIAKVFGAGTTSDGRPYFIMEFVHGIPYSEYCDKYRLSIRDRLELILPVCHAVQHAHHKGIIHRDLKPSNVLITQQDHQPSPRVIDFGLAKALDEQRKLSDHTEVTQFGQVVGSFGYMSPEQAEKGVMDVDTRTDVYAIGAMIYEALCGTTPVNQRELQKKGILQALETIRSSDPPRPSVRLSASESELNAIANVRRISPQQLPQYIRGELDWIVMKSIEFDRTYRYASSKELAEEIERFLNGDVVRARPPSNIYLIKKIWRKHSAAILVTMAIAVILIASTAISTSLAIRASDAEAEKSELLTEEQRLRQVAQDAESSMSRALEGQRQATEEAEIHLDLAQRQEERANQLADLEQELRREAEDNLVIAKTQIYANRLHRSYDEWDTGDLGIAWSELQSCEPELRGIEHGFLHNVYEAQQETHLLEYHATRIAWHQPTFIAIGRSNGQIALFDTSINSVSHAWEAHENRIGHLEYTSDGTHLISIAERDGDEHGYSIKVWDSASFDLISTAEFTGGLLGKLTISPDGERLAFLTFKVRIVPDSNDIESDLSLNVLQLATGELLMETQLDTAPIPDNSPLRSIASSYPDSLDDTMPNMIDFGWAPNDVAFDSTGTKIYASISEPQLLTGIMTEEKLAYNDSLVSRESSLRLCVYDAESGELAETIDEPHTQPNRVNSMLYFPRGVYAVRENQTVLTSTGTVGRRGRITAWNLEQASPQYTLEEEVADIRFTPDRNRIAGIADKQILVFDVANGQLFRRLKGHSHTIDDVAFAPDGQHIASIADGVLKVWDFAEYPRITTWRTKRDDDHDRIFYRPDDRELVACHSPGFRESDIIFFDLKNADERRIRLEATVGSFAVSTAANIIATEYSSGPVRIWNSIDGEHLFDLEGRHSTVEAMAISSDGRFVAAGCGGEYDREAQLIVWRLSDAKIVSQLDFDNPGDRVLAITFSPDSTKLIVGDARRKITIYDVPDLSQKTELLDLQTQYWSMGIDSIAISISPDGRMIAAGIDGGIGSQISGEIVVWDMNTQQPVFWANGHTRGIQDLCFSADNSRLISCGRDDKIKFWATESGVELVSVNSSVSQIFVTPQSQQLLFSTAYDVYSYECVSEYSDDEVTRLTDHVLRWGHDREFVRLSTPIEHILSVLEGADDPREQLALSIALLRSGRFEQSRNALVPLIDQDLGAYQSALVHLYVAMTLVHKDLENATDYLQQFLTISDQIELNQQTQSFRKLVQQLHLGGLDTNDTMAIRHQWNESIAEFEARFTRTINEVDRLEYQKQLDQFTGQGFVPLEVSVREIDGEIVHRIELAYNRPRSIQNWTLRTRATQQAFDEVNRQRLEDDYELVEHHTYQDDDQVWHVGLWLRR